MIDEPTHFTRHSSLLIDLILTNNVNRLIYTGVGPAITDQIRYHCPVIGFINYPNTTTKPLKRKIWLYEHADYEKLKQNLVSVNWDSLFLTDDIELITNEITNAIRAAKIIIGPRDIRNLVPHPPILQIMILKLSSPRCVISKESVQQK
jgi:hypothetical protein